MKNPEQNTGSLNEAKKTTTEIVEGSDGQTLQLTKNKENVERIDLLVTTSIVASNKNEESIAIKGEKFIPDGWRLIDAKDLKDQKKENIPANLKDLWIVSRQREDIEYDWQQNLIGSVDLDSKLILFSSDINKGSMYALFHELGHAHFNKNNPTKTDRHKEITKHINSVKNIAEVPMNIRQELLTIIMENEFQADLWAIRMHKLIQSKHKIDLEPDLSNEEILTSIAQAGQQRTIERLEKLLKITAPEDIDLDFLIQAKEILDLD